MGWVTLSLRKQALKQEQAHYQVRLLQISREKRQMARRKSFETNSILTEQRRAERSLKSTLYDTAKATKKSKLEQLDQAYATYKLQQQALKASNTPAGGIVPPNYQYYLDAKISGKSYEDYIKEQYKTAKTSDYTTAKTNAYNTAKTNAYTADKTNAYTNAALNEYNNNFGTTETAINPTVQAWLSANAPDYASIQNWENAGLVPSDLTSEQNWENAGLVPVTLASFDAWAENEYKTAALNEYNTQVAPTPAATTIDSTVQSWLNANAQDYTSSAAWQFNQINPGYSMLTQAEISALESTTDSSIKSYSDWEKDTTLNNLNMTRDSITEEFENASLEYQDEKNDLKTEYEFELQLAEEEAADEELILDQEQTEIEAQLEAISQEIESVGSAVSSAIQSSTIKLA